MLNMIKADLFRIFKEKGIYICFIIIIGLSILTAYSVTPLTIGLNGQSFGDTIETFGLSEENYAKVSASRSLNETRDIIINNGKYELDVANISHNINLYYFFIAIVVFVLCCDFSNKTIKNTISTNISKKKYYASKLLLALSLGTILIFFNSYISQLIILILDGAKFISSVGNITLLTIRQLPLLYAIISMLVMITFFIRKTSIYNAITIPFIIIFQLLLSAIVKLLSLPNIVLNYEFERALMLLSNNPTTTYIWQCVGLGIAVTVITSLLGYTYFKRTDI